MKTKKITLLLLSSAMCFSLSAKDIFVNATSGADTNDGLTAETSVLTIAQAYEMADWYDVLKLEGTFVFDVNISIEKPLTIQSAGTAKAVLDGDNSTYFFDLKNSVTLKNLTLTKGYGGDGGALNIPLGFQRLVRIEDCVFSANESGGRGGAIWCQTYGYPDDELIINRSAFINNMSGSHGGVIAFIPEGNETNHAVLTINNSTFAQNMNMEGGGGVLFVDGSSTNNATFHINNTTIAGNIGGGNGGNCPGIRFIGNQMKVNIKNSIIEGNIASDGNYYDISFTQAPTELTVINSIIGNVTVDGGTIDQSTFVAVGSDVNHMTISDDPSVAGLGEFTENHYLLSPSSLAYKYGDMENVSSETIVDQLGNVRSDESLCSAGAVEFYKFTVSGLKNLSIPNSNIFAAGGEIKIEAKNAFAKVYNISGILIGSFKVNGLSTFKTESGVYIVCLESQGNRVNTKVLVN